MLQTATRVHTRADLSANLYRLLSDRWCVSSVKPHTASTELSLVSFDGCGVLFVKQRSERKARRNRHHNAALPGARKHA